MVASEAADVGSIPAGPATSDASAHNGSLLNRVLTHPAKGAVFLGGSFPEIPVVQASSVADRAPCSPITAD